MMSAFNSTRRSWLSFTVKLFTLLGTPFYVHWSLFLGIIFDSAWLLTLICGIVIQPSVPLIAATVAVSVLVIPISTLTHEFCHFIAMKKLFNLNVSNVTLHLLGGFTKMERYETVNYLTGIPNIIIALVGPLSNLLIAATVYFTIYLKMNKDIETNPGCILVQFTWLFNLIVGVFNLLPVHLLDGSNALFGCVHLISNQLYKTYHNCTIRSSMCCCVKKKQYQSANVQHVQSQSTLSRVQFDHTCVQYDDEIPEEIMQLTQDQISLDISDLDGILPHTSALISLILSLVFSVTFIMYMVLYYESLLAEYSYILIVIAIMSVLNVWTLVRVYQSRRKFIQCNKYNSLVLHCVWFNLCV